MAEEIDMVNKMVNRKKDENRGNRKHGVCAAGLGCALLALSAACLGEQEPYSPWAGKDYPREVFWGDTHLHTSYSLDASLFGLTDWTPEEAFRFARGETLTASNGMRARLNQPLDFLVVSDHAEYFGVMRELRAGGMEDDAAAQDWRRMVEQGDLGRVMLEISQTYATGKPAVTLPDDGAAPWNEVTRMADEANEPGAFTAFIGFEWSSMPDGNNLHRIVVFADDADKATQITPFSSFDSNDPEDLWAFLGDYEQNTGGRALAIPHNSNVSGGLMFAPTNLAGEPIDAEYARQRKRWEPMMEITQIKGDSEAHPLLSPNDEFADYGTWDQFNIAMSEPQEPWMQQHQYARPALKLGLQLADKTGVNPYAFGVIGSTDSHTGLAAVEEDNFWGKKHDDEPSAERVGKHWGVPEADIPNTAQVAAGYAAVWATENTREALFDAMRRREVYASTGPRMRVRFFGGWEFTEQDLRGAHPALAGYEKGVPMGGELSAAGANAGVNASNKERGAQGEAPAFMVWALKDVDGANLDRIQIVKGWLGEDGETHEQVYDVAWSGDRQPGADSKLPAVGNTVDLERASYRNEIGASQLATLWRDPDFDPAQRAFYYVRVLEIPTPRWPVHDAAKLGAQLPEGTEKVHQERAYTSPIWYRP